MIDQVTMASTTSTPDASAAPVQLGRRQVLVIMGGLLLITGFGSGVWSADGGK